MAEGSVPLIRSAPLWQVDTRRARVASVSSRCRRGPALRVPAVCHATPSFPPRSRRTIRTCWDGYDEHAPKEYSERSSRRTSWAQPITLSERRVLLQHRHAGGPMRAVALSSD